MKFRLLERYSKKISNFKWPVLINETCLKEGVMPEYVQQILTWRQKIAILIRMQFLNDIIKSKHGLKAAQKFHKFRVLIKTLNL